LLKSELNLNFIQDYYNFPCLMSALSGRRSLKGVYSTSLQSSGGSG